MLGIQALQLLQCDQLLCYRLRQQAGLLHADTRRLSGRAKLLVDLQRRIPVYVRRLLPDMFGVSQWPCGRMFIRKVLMYLSLLCRNVLTDMVFPALPLILTAGILWVQLALP